jgi:CRP-like cAMP-binding protein
MSDAIKNHILAGLPDDERAQIIPRLELVNLKVRQILYDVNVPIEHVYFPEDGIVSIVAVTSQRSAVEVGTIGNEGVIGVPVFLGVKSTPNQAFSQVPGCAFRMAANDFRELSKTGKLHSLVEGFAHALFTFTAQTAVCNRVHQVEQRCARWLLMAHDRVGKNPFPLTHDFLSQMLGVRRATVSQTAAALYELGAIDYTRGLVTIVDRQRLEAVACECYQVIRTEYERVRGGSDAAPAVSTQPHLLSFSENGFTTTSDPEPKGA